MERVDEKFQLVSILGIGGMLRYAPPSSKKLFILSELNKPRR